MAPIESGRYFITNRKHKNVATLSDANDHSDVVAGTQVKDLREMWNVVRLGNGTYKIQNYGYNAFANSEGGDKASRGDGIIGGTRPEQWKIVEMRSKGDYCIFPISNTDVCWSLRDGNVDSSIVLGYPPNAPQSQWNFSRVEDTHVPGGSTSPLVAHAEPSSAHTHSYSAHLVPTQEQPASIHPQSEQGVSKEQTTAAEGEIPEAQEQQANEQNSSSPQTVQSADSDPFLLHSSVLPTLNVPLYEALAVDIPLCNSPLDCINADARRVNSVVEQLLALTQNEELGYAAFAKNMIYRRLIVYIFSHLIFCTSQKTLLDEFKETLQQWRTWNDITLMQNHQLVKARLYDLFQRGLNMQPDPTLHSEESFRKLTALDTIGLSAHLAVIVIDNNSYKELLTQRGLAAQSFLNLLQARLDFPMAPQHKARHVKALLRLSRASGLYPESLALRGIEIEAQPIDRGGYGDVFKGVYHGQQVAVKALRIYQTSDLVKLLKEFSSEAVLWRQLSHPNVLPFYGVYHLEEKIPRLCLVAPWIENGNVVEFLKLYPDTYCVHLALDIIQGLEHLHSMTPSIIHGDLKGLNVLINRSSRACLADFGLATTMMDSKSMAISFLSSGKSGGTMRWQAPELLSIGDEETENNQHNSKASDIYAFACICYEMFSGEVPFSKTPNDVQVILSVMRGKRPARPTHALSKTRGFSDELWDLIQMCWAQDPTQRPGADDVVGRLRGLPNLQNDQRPLNDFGINFPSQAVNNHPDHPFSTLASQTTLVW